MVTLDELVLYYRHHPHTADCESGRTDRSATAYGRILMGFSAMVGSGCIVEIGSNVGFSGLCLGLGAMPGVEVFSFEIREEASDEARYRATELGLDDIVHFQSGPLAMDEIMGNVGLAYIDGHHCFSEAGEDLCGVANARIVLLHDFQSTGEFESCEGNGVPYAVASFMRYNPEWAGCSLPSGMFVMTRCNQPPKI